MLLPMMKLVLQAQLFSSVVLIRTMQTTQMQFSPLKRQRSKRQLQVCQKREATSKRRIDELEADMAQQGTQLGCQLTTLRDELASAKRLVCVLESEIDGLQWQVEGLESQVAEQQTQLAEHAVKRRRVSDAQAMVKEATSPRGRSSSSTSNCKASSNNTRSHGVHR
jgi:chromosome segregation ATPase